MTACAVVVYHAGWSGTCHRDATGFLADGVTPACNPHIAGEKRSLKAQERRDAETVLRQQQDDLANARRDELQGLGLKCLTHYIYSFGGGLGRYDPDSFVVKYEDLKRLLAGELR